MWKLMIFGILVQLVLLISILDVNVFEEAGPMGTRERQGCLRNVMVITIEGLEYDDIVAALNDSDAVRDLMKNTAAFHVSSALNNFTNSTNHRTSGSIFDGKRLLYVGPPAAPYEFNTSLWDFILINQERNETFNFKNHSAENDTDLLNTQLVRQLMNYGSYMVNRRIAIDHMRRIIERKRLDSYLMKFINIGRSGPDDAFLNAEDRMWYFSAVYNVIRNSKRASNYVFVITSSMNMLVRNRMEDQSNDTMVIIGQSECVENLPRPSFFLETITHDEAYNKLQGYVFLMSCNNKEVSKDEKITTIVVHGNLLELMSGRVLEMQEMYTNFGVYFTGWETLNSVLTSLDVMELESSPVVLASTIFIFFMWISFLTIKTMKLAVDMSQSVIEVNSTALKLINAICLVLILVLCVAAKIAGCPCRYLIYITIAVLVCRLLCGELFSSVRTYIECSLMDKVKIGLQLFILIGVVESLFWSIYYKIIIIVVFALSALGRVVQGALSAIQLQTIIGFSLSTLLVGVQFLWPFTHFGKLVNINVSASLWIFASVGAIAFLMKNSNHDRFVMFVCVLELLMALSFANVFVIFGTSFHSAVPVIGVFVVLSQMLPLFGHADPKNRLMELATATAAVYVFFSCNGESFFLLTSFIVSFCSYFMDRASAKQLPDDDAYYINIFPATFHTVLLILACYVVTPAGGEAIMRAYTLLNVESKYQLVASGIFYFTKLGLLINLLEATFLSTGQKLMALPNLFIVVIILNLISFRAFIQYSMFNFGWGRKEVYVNQILLHILAALTFYLYSFAQVLCNTNFFTICRKSKATYIPQEAVH